MKQPSFHRQTGLLSVAIAALIGLCLLWALAGQSHSTAAGRSFDSPLRPTHTPKPTRTPKSGISPTPTSGAFVSPLSTPILHRVPFVRPYYGPPTPGPYVPSATATPHPASPRAPGSRFVFLPVMNNSPIYLIYGAKGIGDAWQNWQSGNPGTNMNALDYQWYYDWTFYYLPQRHQDPRYVRMVWCNETLGTDIDGITRNLTDIARIDYNAGQRGRVWLVYNEPDLVDSRPGIQTCGDVFYADPAGAARHFSLVYDLIKAGDPFARVFAGGLVWLGTSNTRTWWNTFIATLTTDGVLYKLEGVHVHLYPMVSTSDTWRYYGGCTTANCVSDLAKVADDWYQQQHGGLGNRPIWITEMGWLHDCTKSREWIRDNFMQPMSQWFAQDPAWPYSTQVAPNPGYSGVAWYVTQDPGWYPCTYLLNSLGLNGTPSALGMFWNAFKP